MGGYEDFLEKIGWEEETVKSKKRTSASEIRKKKHEELMEIREKIRPLENEIRKIERKINELEAEQLRENQLLVEASQKGDAAQIQNLAKSCGQKEQELDMLYENFMKLEKELEAYLLIRLKWTK